VAEIKATTPHSDKAQPCMPASAPRRRRRIRQTRQATRGYRRLQTRLLSWSTSWCAPWQGSSTPRQVMRQCAMELFGGTRRCWSECWAVVA